MFIEDGFTDLCDDMAKVRIEDGFYDDTDTVIKEWGPKEKEEYSFCVGSKEQMSLAVKSAKHKK